MIPLVVVPLLTKLAENGLNILSDAILSKGKEVVEKTLGVDIEASSTSEEGLIRLRQLEVDHEEFLLTIAKERQELNLEQEKLLLADTANARDNNTKIQESSNASFLSKNVGYYLDIAIVLFTLVLASVVLFRAVPPENKELFYMAFGSILTFCSTVVSFHRGTSRGSANKDEIIKTLSKDK